MNKITLTAIAAALAFSAPVFAEDAHHPEKAGEAKSAAPIQPAPQVRKMQDNVKKMQTQLERIAKARTGEEQQKAMAEHMQTMQENMSMARGMQGGMMACPMMEGGMMMGKGSMGMMGGGAAGTPERMQQMEKRMDMMQMMMEQMMRRQDGAPMAPAPMK